jgi:hypothetical protein
MNYYEKYLKYKQKYLELKNKNNMIGGGNIFIENEKKVFDKNVGKMAKKMQKLSDKSKMINFINISEGKKYTDKDFIDISNIKKILQQIKLHAIVNINSAEHFNIFKMKKPYINKKDIDDFINYKKLNLVYSIYNKDNKLDNSKDKIYPMHSIGKVFTGFLIMLLLEDKIITRKDIKNPLQLDKKIINKLPKEVIKRLEETTMLDVMTHMSGLNNYLGNYFDELKKNNKENPIEPEDFIKYIDKDVGEKGKFMYSNAGLLLCGLSVKHLYNKKNKSDKSYNEILDEYIIKPANLKTFSITKPEGAVYNKDFRDNIMEFVNGSPAGGYWISPDDLAKFGVFILDKVKEKPKLKKYLEEYGGEFYHNNIISHSGGLKGSNCWLTVYLKYDTSIAIMDNDGKSSKILKFALDYLS